MQCQHTQRSVHKLAVRLLLYRGCTYMTWSTHKTRTGIHHDHICMAVVHTRIIVSVAVKKAAAASRAKKTKAEMLGGSSTDPVRIYRRAHVL